MTNGNNAAFARPIGERGPTYMGGSSTYNTSQEGLTKREYFAAKAMQGILSDSANFESIRDAATTAVRCADVLIEALSKNSVSADSGEEPNEDS